MEFNPSHAHLLENHIEFLAGQRGPLESRSGCKFIDSDKKSFQIAIIDSPGIGERDLRGAELLFIPPWMGLKNNGGAGSRFKPEYQLRHMTISTTLSGPQESDCGESLRHVEPVDSRELMREFTHVQTAAFSDNEKDYAEWHDWLFLMNQQAMRLPDHVFWLLRDERGTATSCVIAVQTKGILGIYGVGTLPEHRCHGHSSALLQHILGEASDRHIPTAVLQVVVGSYAEEFYANLGFETAFVLDVLKREPSKENAASIARN